MGLFNTLEQEVATALGVVETDAAEAGTVAEEKVMEVVEEVKSVIESLEGQAIAKVKSIEAAIDQGLAELLDLAKKLEDEISSKTSALAQVNETIASLNATKTVPISKVVTPDVGVAQ